MAPLGIVAAGVVSALMGREAWLAIATGRSEVMHYLTSHAVFLGISGSLAKVYGVLVLLAIPGVWGVLVVQPLCRGRAARRWVLAVSLALFVPSLAIHAWRIGAYYVDVLR